MPVRGVFLVLLAFTLLSACKKAPDHARLAEQDVEYLVGLTAGDVEKIRVGLPKGAALLGASLLKRPDPDQETLRRLLGEARGRVVDLRVAKSTFFAFAEPNGVVVRSDRDRDRMAGTSLYAAFPRLKAVTEASYVETTGEMTELARRSDKDAQWVAAVPVDAGGKQLGLYATGWSWSHYARTLQNGLRTHLRLEAANQGARAPLIYVVVIVSGEAYAWRETPVIDSEAVQDAEPAPVGDGVWKKTLEIDGRVFGLAVKRAPALGDGIMIAVLRS